MNRWERTINNQHIQRDISTDVLVSPQFLLTFQARGYGQCWVFDKKQRVRKENAVNAGRKMWFRMQSVFRSNVGSFGTQVTAILPRCQGPL